MKAPSFAYAKPRSLDEVFALAEEHGADAKLLAGGQTLLATLNMRLSSPALLIDITGVPGLSGIAVKGNVLRIGALTKHREIERSPDVARHLPLLAQAAPHIAHVAIRNVGTLGGSLAHADPAAEWPACCIALDAEIVIAARGGERRVKARQFYRGLFETALDAGEVITAVEFPIPGAGYRSAFLELARRRGDYAIVGVAALAKASGGKLSDVRLAFIGGGATPILAKTAMAAIEGKQLTPDTAAAAQMALAKDLAPTGDLNGSPATKMHLARVLCGRALTALAA
ncbi:MAG TPA: xanthine dehydrogenase family protein subunit M [Burkholderiales bacterium]|nr:xanthine dehydrogenase family protein subunit M [Burkholderiales bacterium]